jgi:hypothetical protein
MEERAARSSFFSGSDRFSRWNHSLLDKTWGRTQVTAVSGLKVWRWNCFLSAAMQLTMRTKVTCGFLILAFGMMLTDFYRLMSAPSAAVMPASGSAQHATRY